MRVLNKKVMNEKIEKLHLNNFSPDEDFFINNFKNALAEILKFLNFFQIRKAYILIEEQFNYLNKFITVSEIWKINDQSIKNQKLYIVIESIRVLGIVIFPFIPNLSKNLYEFLDIDLKHINENKIKFRLQSDFQTENFHFLTNNDFFFKINFENSKKLHRKKIITK